METIYKYQLKRDEYIKLDMPKGANIISLQMQNGIPCIWAIVKVGELLNTETRYFKITGTGRPFDIKNLQHVGTIQESLFVWHLFEIITREPPCTDE